VPRRASEVVVLPVPPFCKAIEITIAVNKIKSLVSRVF
jgi:hypothetical protein